MSRSDEHIDLLLTRTRSHSWPDRKMTVPYLAPYCDSDRVYARLVECLDDQDIAVIEVAERLLIEKRSTQGMMAVLTMLSENDDNAWYHVHDQIIGMWLDGYPMIPLLRDALESSPTSQIADEARSLLSEMNAL